MWGAQKRFASRRCTTNKDEEYEAVQIDVGSTPFDAPTTCASFSPAARLKRMVDVSGLLNSTYSAAMKDGMLSVSSSAAPVSSTVSLATYVDASPAFAHVGLTSFLVPV